MSSNIHRRMLAIRVRNLLSCIAGYFGSERANSPRAGAIWGPNEETMGFIKSISVLNIAEIGVYRGYTSLEFAKYLNGKGELHIFDYEDRANAVRNNLAALGFGNVKAFGSSYKLLNSYNWSLSKLIEQHDIPIYDYVFIDGAHTFAIDGLAFYLLDRLLKVGGYMDFDDYNWTLGASPSMRPEVFPQTAKLFTCEQIETPQVAMIINLLVRKTGRYDEIVPNKIFKKMR